MAWPLSGSRNRQSALLRQPAGLAFLGHLCVLAGASPLGCALPDVLPEGYRVVCRPVNATPSNATATNGSFANESDNASANDSSSANGSNDSNSTNGSNSSPANASGNAPTGAAATPAPQVCEVKCDTEAWYVGDAILNCTLAKASDPGILEGCRRPLCPFQCGSRADMWQAPAGADFVGVAYNRVTSDVYIVDAAQHVVMRYLGVASVTAAVLWGALGVAGDSDGDSVAAARLSAPRAVLVDARAQVVYVADSGNGKVRQLTLSSMLTRTLVQGLADPRGLALAYGTQELFISEFGGGAVRRFPLSQSATVFSAGALATVAGLPALANPAGLALNEAAGDLFIAEQGMHRFLEVSLLTGVYSATGQAGQALDGAQAMDRNQATFGTLHGLAFDGAAIPTLFLADAEHSRVYAAELPRSAASCHDLGWERGMEVRGSASVCGRSYANAGAVPDLCTRAAPPGLCCSGAVPWATATAFCERQGARLCTVSELQADEAKEGNQQPTCMTGSSTFYDDLYDQVRVWTSTPCAVAGSGAPGRFTRSGARQWGTLVPMMCSPEASSAYVKCCADAARVVPIAGVDSQVDGWVPAGYSLYQTFAGGGPAGLAWDPLGKRLFVVGGGTLAVLAWTVPRVVVAGDEGLAGVLNMPLGMAWDPALAVLYIADSQNNAVRAVDCGEGLNIMRTVVGQGGRAIDGTANNVSALTSDILSPVGLTFDAQFRSIYVSTGGHRIRRIDLNFGNISSVVNRAGARGLQGDAKPAILAQLNSPKGLAMLGQMVFISDRDNNRVRVFYTDTGQIETAAGPVLVAASTVYAGVNTAVYNIPTDPRLTAIFPPEDLVQVAPVGVAATADGSIAFLSDEQTNAMFRINRSDVPKSISPIQGTSMVADPKSLLVARNGTLFVADQQLHSIFALEVKCTATDGCVAQNVRRIAGAGSTVPGDADTDRRLWRVVTSTTTTFTTSTATTTTTAVGCLAYVLGKPGQDCLATCATYSGTCDPAIQEGFDFNEMQSVIAYYTGTPCKRDSRAWWGDWQPSYETDPTSRDFGSCLGTWDMKSNISCTGRFTQYGRNSTTMQRWCKCRNNAACGLPTTTTSTSTFSTTSTRTTTSSRAITTTSTSRPSKYRVACPTGYAFHYREPATKVLRASFQDRVEYCAQLCEVQLGCEAFTYDGYYKKCSVYGKVWNLTQSQVAVNPSYIVVPGSQAAQWPRGEVFSIRASSTAVANALGVWAVAYATVTDTGSETWVYFSGGPGAQLGLTSGALFRPWFIPGTVVAPDASLCLRLTPDDRSQDILMVDWLPASGALNTPGAMALDEDRQLLYFLDTGNHKVKVLDLQQGKVLTIAGRTDGPFSGDGGPANEATLAGPRGIALDAAGGLLYVADTRNQVIRRVELAPRRLTGVIQTVAGSNVAGDGSDGDTPEATRFRYPWGLALGTDPRTLYVADSSNNLVRMISLSNRTVRVIAGSRTAVLTNDGGSALQAEVTVPKELCSTKGGQEAIFGEPLLKRLRVVDVTRDIIDTVIASYAVDMSKGVGLQGIVPRDYDADVAYPYAVALLPPATGSKGGTLFTASYLYHRIRRTDLSTGVTTTFAGKKLVRGSTGDGGPPALSLLNGPTGLQVDLGRGLLYIVEGDGGRVRQVNLTNNTISTVAASVMSAGEKAYGVALDATNQHLYVSSTTLQAVYRISLSAPACDAPTNITFAAKPSCAEGTQIFAGRCTPACARGYVASETALGCYAGLLMPPQFRCTPGPCRAPVGVVNSWATPCWEGSVIDSGGTCTARCAQGYLPTNNLTCFASVLRPATFSCLLPGATTTQAPTVQGPQTTVAPAGADPANATAPMQGGGTDTVVAPSPDDSASALPGPEALGNNLPVNGSVAVMVASAGLSVADAQLLAATDAVRRPLRRALAQVLSVLETDITILVVVVEAARRRLAAGKDPGLAGRRLQSPSAYLRYLIVYTLQLPSAWAVQRADALRVSGDGLALALEAVGFASVLSQAAGNRTSGCTMPQGVAGAAEVPCAEGAGNLSARSRCTPVCQPPLVASLDKLMCFAGLWSPPTFKCLAPNDLSAKDCAPPPVGSGVADPPCAELWPEGPGAITSTCTPVCVSDLVASEVALACTSGTLRPASFSCGSAQCQAPTGILQAAAPPCVEGSVLTGRCTAVCQSGYAPSANLTCERGFLIPPVFTCVDKRTPVNDGSSESFWGAGRGGTACSGASCASTSKTTTALPSPATPSTSAAADAGVGTSGNSGGVVDGRIVKVLAIVSGVCFGVAALACAGVLALRCWRRRRSVQTAEALNPVEVKTPPPWDWEDFAAGTLVDQYADGQQPDKRTAGGNERPERYEALEDVASLGQDGGDEAADDAPFDNVADQEAGARGGALQDGARPVASEVDVDCLELLQIARATARSVRVETRDAKFEAFDTELAEAVVLDEVPVGPVIPPAPGPSLGLPPVPAASRQGGRERKKGRSREKEQEAVPPGGPADADAADGGGGADRAPEPRRGGGTDEWREQRARVRDLVSRM